MRVFLVWGAQAGEIDTAEINELQDSLSLPFPCHSTQSAGGIVLNVTLCPTLE